MSIISSIFRKPSPIERVLKQSIDPQAVKRVQEYQASKKKVSKGVSKSVSSGGLTRSVIPNQAPEILQTQQAHKSIETQQTTGKSVSMGATVSYGVKKALSSITPFSALVTPKLATNKYQAQESEATANTPAWKSGAGWWDKARWWAKGTPEQDIAERQLEFEEQQYQTGTEQQKALGQFYHELGESYSGGLFGEAWQGLFGGGAPTQTPPTFQTLPAQNGGVPQVIITPSDPFTVRPDGETTQAQPSFFSKYGNIMVLGGVALLAFWLLTRRK